MKNIKANFDNIYSQYSPTEYTNYLLGKLKYELPFNAMAVLQNHIPSLISTDNALQLTILGSSHGLEIAALKFHLTPAAILARWRDNKTLMSVFPNHSDYQVTMIDIEGEPLRFAKDVNLADKTFMANLQRPFSPELEQHFKQKTELLICIGATGYIGIEAIEKILISCFKQGKAQAFCFSVSSYLNAKDYLELCKKLDLQVEVIGADLKQRNYQDQQEKNKIHQQLNQKNRFTEFDQHAMRCDVFLAFKSKTLVKKHNNA